MTSPLISICIPTYERLQYLPRLFESISMQTFRSFEVIITDDSKSDKVEQFVKSYKADFPLYYHHNDPPLGTGKNMLEGRKFCKSEWLKIAHDDDFFATKDALQELANAIKDDGTKFIFSGYNEYFENTGKSEPRTITQKQFAALYKDPAAIFANNIIGPPTVLMLHTSVKDEFDRLRWYVDMEYYYRILQKEKATYISLPLMNVSSNDTQVTTYTRTYPSVVIPEAIYILNLHKNGVAKSLISYDAWWRTFRNLGISTEEEVRKYTNDPIPLFIKKMMGHQRMIPGGLIKNGIVSKTAMSISYMVNKGNI